MAKKPDGTGITNTTPGTCIDVPCKPHRLVTYRIQSGCNSISYALELNGQVFTAFKESALGIKCDGKSEIRCPAHPGDRIALFLNSDAHPDYRKHRVYGISVGNNDIDISIREKAGKHADTDTPVLMTTRIVKNAKGEDRPTDFYTAPLTGDIWLKISHKYLASEVEALLPADTPSASRAAVKKFYDGSLSSIANSVIVDLPAQNTATGARITILIGPGSDKNPLENIQSFDLYKDGLPRVHPLGYLALIEAARDAQVEKLTLSSTWRPMLGSVAHRAGLGLDVNWIEKTHLNREELRGKGHPEGNVSEAEKERFKAQEAAKKAQQAAQERFDKLKQELDHLQALKKSDPGKVDPIREAELMKALQKALAEQSSAQEKLSKATDSWNVERDKNEPPKVKGYRASLARCVHVRQIFDPWFMDANSRDNKAAKPNEQIDPNEKLHATHLHITVNEPKLKFRTS